MLFSCHGVKEFACCVIIHADGIKIWLNATILKPCLDQACLSLAENGAYLLVSSSASLWLWKAGLPKCECNSLSWQAQALSGSQKSRQLWHASSALLQAEQRCFAGSSESEIFASHQADPGAQGCYHPWLIPFLQKERFQAHWSNLVSSQNANALKSLLLNSCTSSYASHCKRNRLQLYSIPRCLHKPHEPNLF